MIRALVMGFGPFGAVSDNPAARLSRAVDGAQAGAVLVRGAQMDVAWSRCWAQTQTEINAFDPHWLIGVGVAVGRSIPMFESVATNALHAGRPDVDGALRAEVEPGGPEQRAATLRLAAAGPLGVGGSDDAGRYVCNAWLYQAIAQAPASVGVAFLHVPAEGLAPDAFLEILRLSASGSIA